MKPGREMDALIQERVLGLPLRRVAIATNDGGKSAAVIQNWLSGPFHHQRDVEDWIKSTGGANGYELGFWPDNPSYSKNIADVGPVLEWLSRKFPKYCIQRWTSDGVEQRGGSWFFYPVEHTECEPLAQGLSLEHVLCLAALKSCGVEV